MPALWSSARVQLLPAAVPVLSGHPTCCTAVLSRGALEAVGFQFMDPFDSLQPEGSMLGPATGDDAPVSDPTSPKLFTAMIPALVASQHDRRPAPASSATTTLNSSPPQPSRRQMRRQH
ncbi:hypothetical protein G7046_g9216 [Stylonectria norvegica]|nr:hypothetical protein G7046_g9216 [Stylonectria norvegica]